MARTKDMLLAVVVLFAQAVPITAGPVDAEKQIRRLIEARQYSQAEQSLAAELQNNPRWADGRFFLAQIRYQTGRVREAREEALASWRASNSFESSFLLATIALDLKELNESIDWLNKAAALKRDEPEVYKLLGMVYALAGVTKQSAAALFEAIRLAPENWEYHYLAGRALYDLEQFPEAEREFDVTLKLNPSSARAWTALGQLHERAHKRSAAEQSYRNAVAVCGDGTRECSWPLLELGRAVEARLAVDEAQGYFARAVAARPDWAKPHFYLGKALAARDQFATARTELETAVRLDGTRPEYFYQLAQVCRQLGDEKAATQHLRRFRQIQAEQKNTPPMELEQP